MYEYGKKIGLCLCTALWFGVLNEARAEDACVEAAKQMKLVSITRNYGELDFDNTKSTAQVGQICGNQAAGCFHYAGARYNVRVGGQYKNIDGRMCAIPHIDVSYDFSGSTLYVTKDYQSCQARVVLRHELQHFNIWKTATEEMRKELKSELRKSALRYVWQCSGKRVCAENLQKEAWNLTQEITAKWERAAKLNNARLDEVDHNNDTDFSYRVCAPYSLKFYQ